MIPPGYPSRTLCEKLTEFDFPKTEEQIELDFTSSPRFLVMPSINELLNELPHFIRYPFSGEGFLVNHYFQIGKNKSEGGSYVRYIYIEPLNLIENDDRYIYYVKSSVHFNGTLQDALAEMWLWCKENNYLTK